MVKITYDDVKSAIGHEYKIHGDENIDEILKSMDDLVGLENIKEEVRTLIDFIKVNQIRKKHGLKLNQINFHSVFYGPPGTGKTTVARLMGRIFKTLGLLSKGHVIEVERADLVAGYIGQTAIKTNEKIDEALNGILFIDEAYALSQTKSGNDFGQEAIECLLKRMEDERDNFYVIVAGYKEFMDNFIKSNFGLQSRFSRYFYFKDYQPDELMAIFQKFCKSANYILTDQARQKVSVFFNRQYSSKDASFGNARFARNLLEKISQIQSSRISKIKNPSRKDLITIEAADVEKAFEKYLVYEHLATKRRIGF